VLTLRLCDGLLYQYAWIHDLVELSIEESST